MLPTLSTDGGSMFTRSVGLEPDEKTGCRRTKILVLILLNMLMSRDSIAQGPASTVPGVPPGLRSAVEKVMRENGVPGGAIAVVTKSGPMWMETFGVMNVATGRAVTRSTVFRTGSVGKSFIALAIMKLQEQGRLNLSAKVSELAPELDIQNPWENKSPVRVIHLLEHTSGFDDMLLSEVRNRTDDPAIPLLEVFRKFPGPQRARWEPGTRVAYSNPGYAVAGYLIEKVTGKRFEEFIQDELLAPLGMKESGYLLSDEMKKNLATGYEGIPPKSIPYYATYMRPGGEFKSTVADMALWLQMLIGRGSTPAAQICSAPSLARIERGETSAAARAGLRSSFGAGIDSDNSKKILTLGHGGAIDGFVATYQYIPAHGVGYAILLDADSDSALEGIEKLVFDDLTRDLPHGQQPVISQSAAELESFEGYYAPENPRAELERFADELTGGIWIGATGGALERKEFLGLSEKLVPVGARRFRRETEPEASFVFIPKDDQGMILAGRSTFYERGRPLWPVCRLILLALAAVVLLTAPVAVVTVLVARRFGCSQRFALTPLLMFAATVGTLVAMGFAFSELQSTLEPKGTAAQVVFLGTILVPIFSFLGLLTTLISIRARKMMLFDLYVFMLALSAFGVTIYLASWQLIGFRPWAY
jgi:CubicO group peptidase (beta-lactamase class C family)